MKRRIRLKSKRRPEVAELDRLCREVVMLRDKGRCAWCGKTDNLQWCHVHTRRLYSMRWNLDNVLALDAGCHLRWHGHPMEGALWFSQTYPDRMHRLVMQRQTKQKPDLAAIKLYLEAQKRKLEAR
jgi:hypothetical protein